MNYCPHCSSVQIRQNRKGTWACLRYMCAQKFDKPVTKPHKNHIPQVTKHQYKGTAGLQKAGKCISRSYAWGRSII